MNLHCNSEKHTHACACVCACTQAHVYIQATEIQNENLFLKMFKYALLQPNLFPSAYACPAPTNVVKYYKKENTINSYIKSYQLTTPHPKENDDKLMANAIVWIVF